MATMLEEAVAHIRAGNIEKARPLLIEFLKQNPQDEDAWLWMSRCVTQTEQKRYCFEKVLKINPQNQHAIKGLQRLSVPAPPAVQPQIVQKPVAQQKPKKSNSALIMLAVIGLLIFGVLSACGIAWLFYSISNNPGSSYQVNSPVSSQRGRPNYGQILEANGFTYFMSDNEGNPSYSSPCGAVAVVKPDNVGFVVSHSPDNNCATADVGRIVSVMYPSEVFDCVITTMNLLDEFDQMLTREAVGHKVTAVITEYEYTLVVIIYDP